MYKVAIVSSSTEQLTQALPIQGLCQILSHLLHSSLFALLVISRLRQERVYGNAEHAAALHDLTPFMNLVGLASQITMPGCVRSDSPSPRRLWPVLGVGVTSFVVLV